MSSRVQQRGQKFKPVPNPRYRQLENSPPVDKPVERAATEETRDSDTPEASSSERKSTSPHPDEPKSEKRRSTLVPPPLKSQKRGRKPKRTRNTRSASSVTFEEDANAGEDLDPTVTTMASICADTGQGRISAKAIEIQRNHAAWKAANREKRANLRALMEAKKYGRTMEGNGDAPSEQRTTPQIRAPSQPQQDTQQILDQPNHTQDGFDYSEALSTNRYNIQVRIGANGETIIDEETLYVDRGGEADTLEYTHVEESDRTKFVNSQSYNKRARGSRWSAEETELFYNALSQFGENYELISFVLPGRDRKSCKNKFKAEDKKNSTRITYCLKNRVPYDVATLSRMTGKDFSGPTPIIRAPVIQTLEDEDRSAGLEIPVVDDVEPKKGRKRHKQASVTDGVEVLGEVESFAMEDDSG